MYDPEDARGLASYSFMETVESNMALFTKRQIHSANQVRNLQAGLAFPSDSDMTWALQSNMIKDCPLTGMGLQHCDVEGQDSQDDSPSGTTRCH